MKNPLSFQFSLDDPSISSKTLNSYIKQMLESGELDLSILTDFPELLSNYTNELQWYSDAEISMLIDLKIKQIGGYVKGASFLLDGIGDGKYPDKEDKRYYVLVTPAIDTLASASPIDFYLDKEKQQTPDPSKPDNRKDIFDEINHIINNPGNADLKILFPYNITNIHWLTGEIKIHKGSGDYFIELTAHNPKGTGELSLQNKQTLCNALEKQIKKLDSDAKINFNNVVSGYTPRQSETDNNSCGVIVVEDIIKRVMGADLLQETPYPIGASELRDQHIALIKHFFAEDNATRINFLRKYALSDIEFESESTLEATVTEFNAPQRGLDLTEQLTPEQQAEIYKQHGAAKYEKNQFEEAIEYYDRAIALNPKDVDAFFKRGFAKFKSGKNTEGAKDHDHAIQLKVEMANESSLQRLKSAQQQSPINSSQDAKRKYNNDDDSEKSTIAGGNMRPIKKSTYTSTDEEEKQMEAEKEKNRLNASLQALKTSKLGLNSPKQRSEETSCQEIPAETQQMQLK